MNHRSLTTLALIGLILSASAPTYASPSDWLGRWGVAGGGGVREVVRNEEGKLSVTLEVRGVGPVTLTGSGEGETLHLEATVRRRVGMAGRLRGERADTKARRVVLEGRRTEDHKTSAVSVAVTVQVGDQTHSETWKRSGKPGLEIVSVSATQFDPKRDDPLKIKFKVIGRPQTVDMWIRLPRIPNGDPEKARLKFYQRLETIRAQEINGGKPLPVGEHEVEWDGRDSFARRIALQGRYKITLASSEQVDGERIQAEKKWITVAPPRLVGLGPNWQDTAHRSGTGRFGFNALKTLKRKLKAFARKQGEYQVETNAHWGDPKEFTNALKESACVYVKTHGNTNGLTSFDDRPRHGPVSSTWSGCLVGGSQGRRCVDRRCWREEQGMSMIEREAIFDSVVDRPWVSVVEENRKAGRSPFHHDGAPFDDVLLVVLYSCSVGVEGARSVPSLLVQLGVDCVVAFETSILSAEGVEFIEAFVRKSIDEGSTVTYAGRRAAESADRHYWDAETFGRNRIKELRDFGVAPLQEVLKIYGDGRVNMFPPRYGANRRKP